MTFRRADLAVLRAWLASPEVERWWGDPHEQYALLAEDLDNPLMVMRIVAYDGRCHSRESGTPEERAFAPGVRLARRRQVYESLRTLGCAARVG